VIGTYTCVELNVVDNDAATINPQLANQVGKLSLVALSTVCGSESALSCRVPDGAPRHASKMPPCSRTEHASKHNP